MSRSSTRTVVVTGGSSGIGAAVAHRFAVRGCRVVVVGRDERALAEAARRWGVIPCRADLAEPGAAEAVLDVAGVADVLVCNAGLGHAGPLSAMDPAEVERLVRVNLLAPAQLVRAALPDMVERGHGHLAFVSSIAGSMAVADEAVYSATKAGLDVLAASVRHEVAPHGIGVSVVVPGAVDTPFFVRRGSPYPRRVPRPVAPDRVARAVVEAVERGRREVFVPRWLRLPARLRGLAPAVTDTLQRRFG